MRNAEQSAASAVSDFKILTIPPPSPPDPLAAPPAIICNYRQRWDRVSNANNSVRTGTEVSRPVVARRAFHRASSPLVLSIPSKEKDPSKGGSRAHHDHRHASFTLIPTVVSAVLNINQILCRIPGVASSGAISETGPAPSFPLRVRQRNVPPSSELSRGNILFRASSAFGGISRWRLLNRLNEITPEELVM